MQDILKPATVVLLNTLDFTLNSNTMLFKVRADRPLTGDNDQAILEQFLQGPLFPEMFLEFAWLRQPGYLISDENGVGQPPVRSPAGRLIPASAHVTLTPLNERTFVERIHWMLTTAFSPYRTHVSEQRAQEVLSGFFWEVFTPESWPVEQSNTRRYWDECPWAFYDIAPNFLHSTGYFTAPEEYEPPDFAYFGGGEADTGTFFYQGEVFYLLLTNGSP